MRLLGVPLVVAAVFFFFAWFRTRKKMLFSDAHGSRWDVAGLALACLAGSVSVFGWERFVPLSGGLLLVPGSLAVILIYLAVAALFRFREATDSLVICGVALLVLALALPDNTGAGGAWTVAGVALSALLAATAQSFLTWRLEAFDFFLINTGHCVAGAAFCAVAMGSAGGAKMMAVAGVVMVVGLGYTLARRRLQLTLAFGLLYGFLVFGALAYAIVQAGPPRVWLVSGLALASLVAPALCAGFPAIAESRKRTRILLPVVATLLALAAMAVAQAGV